MPRSTGEIISGTLFIVESPVLAAAINRLKLPQITAFATRGFAWLPTSEPGTGRLIARANPELSGVRKALKQLHPAFYDIVIAADADPSGYFISRAVAKFLGKRGGIRFGQLTAINAEALEKAIATARPELPFDDEQLRRHFFIRQQYRSFFSEPLPLMLALGLLSEPFPAQACITPNKKHFIRSLKPALQSAEVSLKLRPSPAEGLYPAVPAPPSAAVLPYVRGQRFAATQEQLSRLFCFQDDALRRTLISYPRTRSVAWYPETWDTLGEQLQRTEPGAVQIPEAMRAIAPAGSAHEALHVSSLSDSPHQMRAFLKKDLLFLYELIYRHTKAAVCIPPALHKNQILKDEQERLFWADLPFLKDEVMQVKPVVTLQQFMQMLLNTGWVTAGSLGTATDAVLASGHITLETRPEPHLRVSNSALAQELCLRAQRTRRMMESAAGLKSDTALSPAQFNKLCTQLFRDEN